MPAVSEPEEYCPDCNRADAMCCSGTYMVSVPTRHTHGKKSRAAQSKDVSGDSHLAKSNFAEEVVSGKANEDCLPSTDASSVRRE